MTPWLAVLSLFGLLATEDPEATEKNRLCALGALYGQSVAQEDKVGPLSRQLESADVRKIYHAMSDLAALGEPALPAIEGRVREAGGRTRGYLNLVADEIRSARLTTRIPSVPRLPMKASHRDVVAL